MKPGVARSSKPGELGGGSVSVEPASSVAELGWSEHYAHSGLVSGVTFEMCVPQRDRSDAICAPRHAQAGCGEGCICARSVSGHCDALGGRKEPLSRLRLWRRGRVYQERVTLTDRACGSLASLSARVWAQCADVGPCQGTSRQRQSASPRQSVMLTPCAPMRKEVDRTPAENFEGADEHVAPPNRAPLNRLLPIRTSASARDLAWPYHRTAFDSDPQATSVRTL